MLKEILLSNGKKVIFDSITSDGYEEVLKFYEPKISTLVNNWRNVPHHDREDLLQVCRIKLLEALQKFNTDRNVNFSTYVYTIWNRKIFQIIAKYKSKKHSSYIENDFYINLNFSFDKTNSAYLLKLKKDKCPIKREIIDNKTCLECPYFVNFQNKNNSKHTLCKYYSEVLNKRGENNTSLNQKLKNQESYSNDGVNLLDFISCRKQKKSFEENELKMDLDDLRNELSDLCLTIINFLLDGLNKSEIMRNLEITSLDYDKNIEKLSKNKKLKDILLK